MNETIFAPDTGAAAAGTPGAGNLNAPQDTIFDETDQKQAEFENLIRGEYKREFEKRVQKIIDKRFRDMRLLKEQLAKTKPIMDALYEKYGETDAGKLVQMLKDDAEGKLAGITDRRRSAVMKAMKWRAQADELKKMNPEFNLENEMKSAAFKNLLKAGVDMESAYRAMHQDEILDMAVRYAAQAARDQTMRNMRRHMSRPEENGAGGRGGAKMAPLSVNNMTRAEREEIEKRCARGEKVYFS